MTWWKQGTFIAATILVLSGVAGAWLRMPYQDATVAERSELIVVGHLDKDSIQYVPHEHAENQGASWEYHATLFVTEVLKGDVKEKQIPIVINYGLDPLIGGHVLRDNKNIWLPAPDSKYPPDRIDIIDNGGLGGTVLEEAEKDNLWFLRHLGGELGREPGKGPLGIVDPQDVAALKFKGFFKALLSKDADLQLDRLLTDPDEAVVSLILRHLAAQHRPADAPRIVKLLSSPKEKIQALAAQALADVADRSAVPTFRQALGHANPEVRATACSFLCRFRDTESIPAIAKTVSDLDADRRMRVIPSVPDMESRAAVDLLLDQLDEHLDANPRSSMYPYGASVAAAKALKTLTGIEFPLESAKGRRLWDKLKEFPEEILLRKSMLEDIEALTSATDYEKRWDAYETLGRLANRHFGSYDAFHSSKDAAGREASQRLWRSWAKDNITRTRTDWICDGFADSGIVLPRPLDAQGIDLLIKVLDFYGSLGRRGGAAPKPDWSIDGGWVKGHFHRYNANRLLEQLTGFTVGFSPYQSFMDYDCSPRWAAWWKENRDKVKNPALPEEKPVTAEMLANVPSLRQLPPPLSLTIRPKQAVHVVLGKEPFTILVEIKNTSSLDVLVAQRPSDWHYAWATGNGSGNGGGDTDGREGLKKEDYVTLAPGQTIAWEQTRVPLVDAFVTPPASIDDLQYELTYSFAGTQFGLHAWRGKLRSNLVSFRVEANK